MASAELILAAIGGADLCLKLGNELIKIYRAYKDADNAVYEKILTVEAMWMRTVQQVEFMESVAAALPENHRRIQEEVLEMLVMKFSTATKKLQSVLKKPDKDGSREQGGDGTDNGKSTVGKAGGGGGVKNWKYAIPAVHKSLNDTVSSLENWQRIFDPTWYLILRVADVTIDKEFARAMELASPSSSTTTLVQSTTNSKASPNVVVGAQKLRGTILRLGSSSTTEAVHITLGEDGLDWPSAKAIPHSTTRLVQRAKGTPKIFAVDTIACGSSNLDVQRARSDAEALARKLKQLDPKSRMGILPCVGLVKRKNPATRQLASIDMVFPLPAPASIPGEAGPPVLSLREHLIRGDALSLSRRLDVARQLAEAVSFVHTCDFVHKNVRPEAVLVFPDTHGRGGDGSATLGSAYLLGFDSFRSVSFHTLRTGDAAWERNLYRHPLRQGLRAQEDYAMHHDVYSLGVCLLELGLWRSFVEYEDGGSGLPTREKQIPQIEAYKGTTAEVKDKDQSGASVATPEPTPSPPPQVAFPSPALGGLTLDNFAFNSGEGESAALAKSQAIKDHLVRLARAQLPVRMGDIYTAVVVTCLTCLDKGNEDFGDEEEMIDEDGVLIGVRFIEKVLLKLGSITV